MLQKIQETAQWIKQHTALTPRTAVVLGTGLGRLAAEIEVVDAFPYADIPNFPVSTVEGHSGRLIFGMLGGKPVMALEGRFHYYEGYDMKQV
ncbi:MAG: purine-nucleoside phosphorylase, partial [Bacteroidaceae bacterium]|nr:purine-nucleoside phosphorylase [Bacteroidaceae bacterium]